MCVEAGTISGREEGRLRKTNEPCPSRPNTDFSGLAVGALHPCARRAGKNHKEPSSQGQGQIQAPASSSFNRKAMPLPREGLLHLQSRPRSLHPHRCLVQPRKQRREISRSFDGGGHLHWWQTSSVARLGLAIGRWQRSSVDTPKSARSCSVIKPP